VLLLLLLLLPLPHPEACSSLNARSSNWAIVLPANCAAMLWSVNRVKYACCGYYY
jgi:hypothetical protein